MPTLYDIDFNIASVELLPVDKRVQPNVSIWRSFFTPLQWVHDLLFTSYKVNATAPDYAPGSYAKYDQVVYGKKVYSSKVSSNTDLPTITDSWSLIQDNFIGTDERVLYNGEKLIFEWALNKWFGTTFRQPYAVSDIYIGNNPKPVGVFRVGGIEEISSIVYNDYSSEYIINGYTFGAYNNFTIYVPVATYNALSSTAAERERIFRSFADKYVTCGLFYNIVTY